jgi:hypothetical protein
MTIAEYDQECDCEVCTEDRESRALPFITGYGYSPQYHYTHSFRKPDGLPECTDPNNKRRNFKIKASVALPDWDPNHPLTCPWCKRIMVLKSVKRTKAHIMT